VVYLYLDRVNLWLTRAHAAPAGPRHHGPVVEPGSAD
jgi:hypothetical protein